MKKSLENIRFLFLLVAIGLFSCNKQTDQISIESPNKKIVVTVETIEGQLFYSVINEEEPIVNKSRLGFLFKNMPDLGNNVKINTVNQISTNETWEQVWGEKRLIENRFEELVLNIKEKNGLKRNFNLYFKVFNDGLGFRYEIPVQQNVDSIIITDELTQFNIANIYRAWWASAYKDKFYESLYKNSIISDITDTVITPLTLELSNNKFVAIHEANLTDYAALNIYFADSAKMETDLTPWSTGEKVFAKAGMVSPWRTITIGNSPGDLITSYIALNLNEPNKIDDTSWIKPGKYMGIWWSIHMGKHTWKPGSKHGATTENTKAYIDFAADNGFEGVLVEGWNNGWDFDWTTHGDSISFTEAYPDFDLEEITRYGASKNVNLIGHHETGGATKNYENQMEKAFKL
jgi:alpha-glucosidase